MGRASDVTLSVQSFALVRAFGGLRVIRVFSLWWIVFLLRPTGLSLMSNLLAICHDQDSSSA